MGTLLRGNFRGLPLQMSDDVTQWLQEHELGKYTEIFAHNDVAYGNLRLLTDEDLREIGLPVGPRRRFFSAIGEASALRDDEASPMAASVAASRTVPSTISNDAERRQLTVMFCDLVGSTELSQRFSQRYICR